MDPLAYIKANLQSIVGQLLKNRETLIKIQSTPYADNANTLLSVQSILENEVDSVEKMSDKINRDDYSYTDVIWLSAKLGGMYYHNEQVKNLAKRAGVEEGFAYGDYVKYGAIALGLVVVVMMLKK